MTSATRPQGDAAGSVAPAPGPVQATAHAIGITGAPGANTALRESADG